MGKIISKLTGADKQAKAVTAAANAQAEATRQAAEASSKAAREAAAQAARQQEAGAARSAAEGAAADALSKPLENADVELDGVGVGDNVSAAGYARRKRQTFGLGVGGSGVNI